ncbi:MAG: hypothetical protein ACYC7D_14800 [Nitrososphaerales archaeon]
MSWKWAKTYTKLEDRLADENKLRPEFLSALKAGSIAGTIWASLMVCAGLIYLKIIYSELLNYDNGLLTSNPNALGGMTAIQSINYGVEISALETYLLGIVTGGLTVFVLVLLRLGIFSNQSYARRGVIVGVGLGLVYAIGFIPIIGLFLWGTTLAITLFSGLIGGHFYSIFRIKRVEKLEKST